MNHFKHLLEAALSLARLRSLSAVLLISASFSSTSEAGVVTFEGFGPSAFFGGVASSDGFELSSTDDHFHIGDQILGYGVSGVLLKDRNFAMTMTQVGDIAFDLSSADVGQDFSNPGPATGVVVTGFFSAGGSISTIVPMPTGPSLFTHALFSGFTDLKEVTFQGTGNSSTDPNANGFVLDNIATTPATTAVPEPATAVLFGILAPLLLFLCRGRLRRPTAAGTLAVEPAHEHRHPVSPCGARIRQRNQSGTPLLCSSPSKGVRPIQAITR